MAVSDFGQAAEAYHLAAAEFVKGDPDPYKRLFSQSDDVTLGNPFGPFRRGWTEVAETMELAATYYADGEVDGFENVATHVTPDLAYLVEVERFRAKMGGSAEMASVALRTTSVLRPEEGAWKIVHRHADPITSARPVGSVVQT
jgi:ketosteroid isomerase-like protein